MKRIHTLAALTAATLSSQAAITMTKGASGFTNTYNGNEIFDGTSYVNGWDDNAAGTNESVSGSVLTIGNATNTGWVQQNNGSSDWETQLTPTSPWTLETRVNVNDGNGGTDNVLNLWLGNATNTIILNISETGIGTFNNNSNLDATANTGFVTVRVAYDNVANAFSVWRNDSLLSDTVASNFNDNTADRLIVGECCTSVSHTTAMIEYVNYDTSGAFAPVPEPSSALLLGFSGFGLLVRRRK